jgi:hypothetical protein
MKTSKIKSFETFNEDLEFKEIHPKPKISDEFEKKSDSMAMLILSSPEYSHLVEMAKKIDTKYEESPYYPELKEFIEEFTESFPKFVLPGGEYVNTGVKIPFYGRTKTSTPTMFNFYTYLIDKIKNPGYKY